MKRFVIDGTALNIPDEKINQFLTEFPNAKESLTIRYEVGSKKYDIPQDLKDKFLTTYPDAKQVSIFWRWK